jgi:hypothetical protein
MEIVQEFEKKKCGLGSMQVAVKATGSGKWVLRRKLFQEPPRHYRHGRAVTAA